MKLIVFGATGTIGRHVVRAALEARHEVTAFARTVSGFGADFSPLRGALSLRQGDVLNAASVAAAIPGHDAVVLTLGAGARSGLRAPGTAKIVNAMQAAGVRRLIALSTLGAGDSRAQLNFFWKHVMFGMLLRRALADHEAQEALIRASDTDWTIVRPAAFTDDPETEEMFHGDLSGKELSLKVPRANVGRFIVGELASARYLHQAPGLSC